SNLEGVSKKVPHQVLRVSMDRLSLETLKMLCKELSEVGTKQALVVRLASRIKNFDRSKTTDGGAGVQGFSVLDLQYIALEKSLKQIVQQYRSQGYSEMYGNSRLFRQSRNPGVVCFICEEQGHIAWDCPQKNDSMAEEQMLFSKGMKLARIGKTDEDAGSKVNI
ncbi:20877_t:CDS:2, partial [Gigaspora rosea]